MRSLFLIVVSVIFISGCAPSIKISESEYQIIKLTNEVAESRDKDFFVYVPQGWFSTKDQNFDGNEIWLVKENYTGIVQIRKIHYHSTKKQANNSEDLLEIAKTNLALHRRKLDKSFKLISPPKLYRSGNLIYSSYKFNIDGKQNFRIVLFEKNGNIFECKAYNSIGEYGKISIIELYTTQESVVSSLSLR